MTKIFSWQPCVEAQGQTRYAVRKARFGDGYSQVVPQGLNNIAQTWQLSFRGTGREIMAIQTFLDATRGSEPFYWRAPLRSSSLFRVDSQRGVSVRAHGGELYTLEVTFEEVFAP
ncbi:phage tail protein [Paraburkholderia sp. Tr-20389]|uniref:phage tail protein n=1 Tax=Paraburkholderia sp. Tr-20389 TaxID=2703903 RepID=UPI00197DC509|nr:phage tail protein [Paraburkholderia sp. Tr-20389]MBN3758156.1 phage tail protein [Paraburkholderia sp. Tr-20389]